MGRREYENICNYSIIRTSLIIGGNLPFRYKAAAFHRAAACAGGSDNLRLGGEVRAKSISSSSSKLALRYNN
jgi:hypothetical protein